MVFKAVWLYVSCSSATESAKFKFELANEVAVLESAKFELPSERTVLKPTLFPYNIWPLPITFFNVMLIFEQGYR